jgi:SEC-C motif
MARDRAGRNDLCACGSGKKFKRCCAIKQQKARGSRLMTIVVFAVIAGGIAAAIASFSEEGSSIPTAGKVWSPEHGHYH